MNVLRSILYFLILLVVTPPYTLVVICFFFLPHRIRRRSVAPWVAFVNWLVKHVLGITYELRGKENIPAGPVVILCKHQSAWETLAMQEIFPDVLFVWKKELKLIPFFGWALAVTPMISIDRKAGKDAMRSLVEQGRDRLSKGYSVIIFPEGTRAAPGSQNRYKAGGAFLAVQTGATVLPVAMNSGEYWGRNAFFKTPGKITVSVGPALDVSGLTADQVLQHVESWIESEMRNISPHLYATTESAAQPAS